MVPARDALESLKAGNQRFLNGPRELPKLSDEARQAFSEVRDGEASPSEGYMVSLAAA